MLSRGAALDRPYTLLSAAMSVDGKIATALCLFHSNPFPYAAKTLQSIRDKGILIGGASGRYLPASCTFDQLRKFNLLELFDKLVLNDEINSRKPSPALLVEVARRLAVDPSGCLSVGDTPLDILAAQNAGMDDTAVTCGLFSKEQLLKLEPDFVVESIEYLPDALGIL